MKAAISLSFFLTLVTTASPMQQRTSGENSSNDVYNRSRKPIGVAYSTAAQSTQAAPPSSPGTLEEHFEARRQNFKSGREMLLDKGVTFEPEDLLRDQRPKAVKDALDAMPEMHQSRYETAPLKGAYLADTLFLPENVQVDGHTVIVANYVVFEGTNPIIKGPYDVTIIPSKPIAVLGMSVAEALHRKGVVVNVGMGGTRILPSFALMQDLKIRSARVTIDTSGSKPQTARRRIQKASVNLKFTAWDGLRPVLLQNQDTSGLTGDVGAIGAPGGFGVDGISEPKATPGNCTDPVSGSNGGTRGADGTGGKPGGSAGAGGQGGRGHDAGSINVTIQDGDLNQYSMRADGGTGGQGGEGGKGGPGGNGGVGGSGGDGVACGCNLGRGGDAGHGANGGPGGPGAIGGQGGPGGNGGTITVSLPAGSPGVTTSNGPGAGGTGGAGGVGGTGGVAGAAGQPGSGAIACNQTGALGNVNFGGSGGSTGSSADVGPIGTTGAPGPTPSITFRSAPPAPKPPPPPCSPPPGSPGGDKPLNGVSVPCSPIIIDVTGDGFFLTSAAQGVKFDIANTGAALQISWTAGSSNAFLVLDRNGNGVINSGAEMFGNFTPQPASDHPNGFLALAEYDKPENGGNGDGVIDAKDAIYSQLRLWVDANHDGISQPGELHTLPEMGVFSISLDYSLSMRTDEFGNVFRYKAKINQGANGQIGTGKQAYDVFFVSQ